ncbi:MAG: polysaccharide deacetylase family protein [Bacteroidetes bacterium]|nr:MAG: polysaccharide deacetylase family protein [Bacteroidota bacterium]
MYRYTTPGIFQLFNPLLTWKVSKEKEPVIYLTFDDGPHPEITPWVLDQLNAFQAKATFFCVGDNVERYPEVVERIQAEGHSLGNHTFNHLNGWKSGNDFYLSNIEQCEALTDTKLFRPPYGKIGPLQALKLKKSDYKVIMWTLLSRDYEKDLDVAESAYALKKHSEAGSIILFHDSEKARHNLIQLLPDYLEHFHQRGFQFKAL